MNTCWVDCRLLRDLQACRVLAGIRDASLRRVGGKNAKASKMVERVGTECVWGVGI